MQTRKGLPCGVCDVVVRASVAVLFHILYQVWSSSKGREWDQRATDARFLVLYVRICCGAM